MRFSAYILPLILFGCFAKHAGDPRTSFSTSTKQLKSDIIPDSILQMVNLKNLSITGMDCDYKLLDDKGNDITECWMIKEIPRQIRNLKNLETLQLTLTAISTIPSEIGELENLRSIDLTDNSGLTDISPLTKLASLEELYLNGCSITRMPNEMTNLKRLRKLGLVGNHLDSTERERIKKDLPNCEIIFE
jgi:hypothetical protein